MSERGVTDVKQELAVLYERRQQLSSEIMAQNREMAQLREEIVKKQHELSDLRYPAGAEYMQRKEANPDE